MRAGLIIFALLGGVARASLLVKRSGNASVAAAADPVVSNKTEAPVAGKTNGTGAIPALAIGCNMNASVQSFMVGGATLPNRPPGYRSAWDDCGGAGASATERMRTIAAGIKGFAKPTRKRRHAAQDAGRVQAMKPGKATRYTKPQEAFKAAGDARSTAATALDKYGHGASLLHRSVNTTGSDAINSSVVSVANKTATTNGTMMIPSLAIGCNMNASVQSFMLAGAVLPNRPPGYRSAWDDCGGAGASATERMRTIAAGIKGFAKPVRKTRHAAQDAGKVEAFKPGTATRYTTPAEAFKAAGDGHNTAATALDKYGVH